MLLCWILVGLAVVSLAINVWQLVAGLRFPLHRRDGDASFRPAVSVLKPLKGGDAHTRECLRSWLAQEHDGAVEVLFGVDEPGDPAAEIVRNLLAEFPQADARLIICDEPVGLNGKVSKLARLEAEARHEIIVVSDADVKVPTDFLANVVKPLRDSAVGLVNCFYRLANPTTPAMRWEAVAVNADFWSQVLQARTLWRQDFALGAAMALRRDGLARIGGFRALADQLADDYQLGHRIFQLGQRIELSPVVVECWDAPQGWRRVWRHQLRWARTIRVCRPWSFFASLINNFGLWAMTATLCLIFHGVGEARWWGAGAILLREMQVEALIRRLNPGRPTPFFPAFLKDWLAAVIWLQAWLGNRVTWHDVTYQVGRDGRLREIARR